MGRSIVFSVLAACGIASVTVTAAAGDGHLSAQQSVYTYAIEVGGDGSVKRSSPHGFAPDATSRKLDEQIAGWIFEAAEDGGTPVSTTTYLRVVVAPRADGGFDVMSATTGPAPRTLSQPDYSIRDQLAGMEGAVVLKLAVDADGRVDAVEVHDMVGDISRAMAGAAKSAALTWTFAPETVAGKPVASTVLWPVCYLGAETAASSCAWRGPDAQLFSSKTVLTLNPATRLVSPLALEAR